MPGATPGAPAVLVTGAGGFVGRQLCRWLTDRRWAVRAGHRSAPLQGAPDGSPFVIGDMAGNVDWHAAVSGMHAVVHLAARVHVMRDLATDPLAAFRAANVTASERLARAAAAAGVRRFVYLSSVKVNGEATPGRPYDEQDPPAPQDAYGVSKWEAEQALRRVAAETGLEVAIIRPPLVYGPGVGANFRRLMGLAEKGLPLPLGAVRNRRSLLYVGNLCSAIEACLEHPAAAGKTFLVSDGEDISSAGLIRRLARLLEAPDRLWPLPPALLRLLGALTGKSAEVSRLLDSLAVDGAGIRRQLHWHPPFSLEQGLAATVADYRHNTASVL